MIYTIIDRDTGEKREIENPSWHDLNMLPAGRYKWENKYNCIPSGEDGREIINFHNLKVKELRKGDLWFYLGSIAIALVCIVFFGLIILFG